MSGPNALPIQVVGVTLRFGDRTALHDVDLTARRGELVALTGPNGSGKTTLLRCILGLAEPDAGEVLLFGEPTTALTVRARARQVAWVPQEEAPRDNVRVLSYVLYGRYAHQPPFGGETEADRTAARRALEDVGLADRADRGVFELSGGERQRLLLARSLAQEAPILLLDEPTAHLDIAFQLDILDRVRSLVRERGVCAVAALHDLNLAGRYADRVVVLAHGRRVADGLPEQVLTPALLREVWGVEADVKRDPRSGLTYLLPRRLAGPSGPAIVPGLRRGPVHVVGGGGAASALLQALTDDGFAVTAGALPLLDSDEETCEELGIPYVAEVPFAPLSDEVRAQHRVLLEAARVIVVAPFAVGPANVANLEDLVGRAPRVPVLLLATPSAVPRDFTGGQATRLLSQLLSEGARSVPDVASVRSAVAAALSASA